MTCRLNSATKCSVAAFLCSSSKGVMTVQLWSLSYWMFESLSADFSVKLYSAQCRRSKANSLKLYQFCVENTVWVMCFWNLSFSKLICCLVGFSVSYSRLGSSFELSGRLVGPLLGVSIQVVPVFLFPAPEKEQCSFPPSLPLSVYCCIREWSDVCFNTEMKLNSLLSSTI